MVFRYINKCPRLSACSQAIIKSYLELSSSLFIHASTSIIECINIVQNYQNKISG